MLMTLLALHLNLDLHLVFEKRPAQVQVILLGQPRHDRVLPALGERLHFLQHHHGKLAGVHQRWFNSVDPTHDPWGRVENLFDKLLAHAIAVRAALQRGAVLRKHPLQPRGLGLGGAIDAGLGGSFACRDDLAVGIDSEHALEELVSAGALGGGSVVERVVVEDGHLECALVVLLVGDHGAVVAHDLEGLLADEAEVLVELVGDVLAALHEAGGDFGGVDDDFVGEEGFLDVWVARGTTAVGVVLLDGVRLGRGGHHGYEVLVPVHLHEFVSLVGVETAVTTKLLHELGGRLVQEFARVGGEGLDGPLGEEVLERRDGLGAALRALLPRGHGDPTHGRGGS
mmetsp:Transcript_10721/g.26914  ORF Transcript_10721/g.26914 Transcript_10721/m.26914 type:complete len:341 (-) Transcript_10721:211-1233(-)